MTAAPRAKKSLGQHFLKDAKTSARIVDLLRIGPEDRVLEIGPGPGAITGITLAAGETVNCTFENTKQTSGRDGTIITMKRLRVRFRRGRRSVG